MTGDMGEPVLEVKFDRIEFDRKNSVLKLSGLICDPQTTTPLPKVKITLLTSADPGTIHESRINYYTDKNGRFDFQATIYPQEAILKTSFIGYNEDVYVIHELLANRSSNFKSIDLAEIEKHREQISSENCEPIELSFTNIQIDQKRKLIRITGRIRDKKSLKPLDKALVRILNYRNNMNRKSTRKMYEVNWDGRFFLETEVQIEDELRFAWHGFYSRNGYCQEVYYIDQIFFNDRSPDAPHE